MKCAIGIDPGKLGAIAVVTELGLVWSVKPMPVVGSGKGSHVDHKAVWDILNDLGALGLSPVLVCIEKVGGHMGDSPSSAFEFGRALGVVETVIALRNLRIEYVEPQRWQTLLLKGQPRGSHAERKKSAAVVAAKMFPGEDLRQRNADAMLIAEFARRLAHHQGLM